MGGNTNGLQGLIECININGDWGRGDSNIKQTSDVLYIKSVLVDVY